MASARTRFDSPAVPSAAAPWTQQLIAAVPIAPAWMGLGIALAQIGFCAAFLSLSGGADVFEGQSWPRILGPNVIMASLLGYAAAAIAYSARAQARTLDQLRDVLRVDDAQFRALRLEAGCFDMRWLRVAGFAGAAGAVLLVLVAAGDGALQTLITRAES